MKLDNIFLGNMKLFSNQPMFERVGGEVPQKQQVNSNALRVFNKEKPQLLFDVDSKEISGGC